MRAVDDFHPDFRRNAGKTGRVELVDWDGTVVWAYDNDDLQAEQLSTVTTGLHHDVVPLPNGTFPASTYETFTPAQAMAQGQIVDSWLAGDLSQLRPLGIGSQ